MGAYAQCAQSIGPFCRKKMMGDGTHSIPPSRSYDRVDQFVFYAPQKNRTTTWAAKMRRNIDNG